MRFSFSPRKRERKIFMGTLLPEEKKARDLIEDVMHNEEHYLDVPEDNNIRKIVRSNEAGL